MARRKRRKTRRRKLPTEGRAPSQAAPPRGQETRSRGLPGWKRIIFSLTPVCLLLLGAEGIVRLVGTSGPKLRTLALPEESAGLFRPDPDLFWCLRPGLDTMYEGARVTSNKLGLRAPEVEEKQDNEFRILSLGESSTFGVGVANDQTYTASLPRLLQAEDASRTFTAFNAGVSAWSSFQSLTFLEGRGLKLEPDLVLFYHELNDYLPSTLRDSGNTEIGARMTDRELHASRTQSAFRALLNTSALFRLLHSRYAYWTLEAFNRDDFENPLLDIGLPDIGIAGRLASAEGDSLQRTTLNEKSLGQRVSEEERRQNFTDLVRLCIVNEVALIIIHPSYRSSTLHPCLLTDFCRENNVLMHEAFNDLHPSELDHTALYHDAWHPSPKGHQHLARGLASFIRENVLGKPVSEGAP